jgi:hypothetical protein
MSHVDVADWLTRAAKLFDASRQMVGAVPRRYGWVPEPGSIGERDFAEQVVADEKENGSLSSPAVSRCSTPASSSRTRRRLRRRWRTMVTDGSGELTRPYTSAGIDVVAV